MTQGRPHSRPQSSLCPLADGAWAHDTRGSGDTIPEVLDSRTSGLHVLVIKSIQNTVTIKYGGTQVARVGITFKDLLTCKASMASLHVALGSGDENG